METYPLYIDGQWVMGSATQPVVNPASAEPCAQAAVASGADVAAAVAAARRAFDRGPWRDLSLAERAQFLLKISQGIAAHAQEFARLETLNTGKPLKESTFMDIPSAVKTFEHCAHNLAGYLRTETVAVTPEINGQLVRQPYGVAALVVPWNYPLLIASWKMASALAAGNTVVLKPSSLTPLTALVLARVVHEAGIPAGVVNVVNGGGASVGAALCADAGVDMISFTGGNEVGRQVMGYAAAGVKKVLVELGGKSAAIVCKDADLELAVNGSLCSAFLNQGQMCTQMSRILVADEVYDRFIADFVAKARRIKLGAGSDPETQMGPLISAGQRDAVAAAVQRAVKEGAQCACGGIPDEPVLRKGFFFSPTVLTGVTPAMEAWRTELFGPVVAVTRFARLDQAVALANDSAFGLANCVWTQDVALGRRIAAQVNAGTTWINTYGMFYNELPYGGFGRSGFGKELGREGFLEYTRLKNIVADETRGAKPLVNYWYGF